MEGLGHRRRQTEHAEPEGDDGVGDSGERTEREEDEGDEDDRADRTRHVGVGGQPVRRREVDNALGALVPAGERCLVHGIAQVGENLEECERPRDAEQSETLGGESGQARGDPRAHEIKRGEQGGGGQDDQDERRADDRATVVAGDGDREGDDADGKRDRPAPAHELVDDPPGRRSLGVRRHRAYLTPGLGWSRHPPGVQHGPALGPIGDLVDCPRSRQPCRALPASPRRTRRESGRRERLRTLVACHAAADGHAPTPPQRSP